MITSPFVFGLAKVVAIGALMAGGAGGIYVVASTQSDEGEPQVAAETPVQTATAPAGTSTPDASTPTEPAGTSTPTPAPILSAEQTSGQMWLAGSVWVNARPARVTVRALINGTECAAGKSGGLMDGPGSFFFMMIPSANERTGLRRTRGASPVHRGWRARRRDGRLAARCVFGVNHTDRGASVRSVQRNIHHLRVPSSHGRTLDRRRGLRGSAQSAAGRGACI